MARARPPNGVVGLSDDRDLERVPAYAARDGSDDEEPLLVFGFDAPRRPRDAFEYESERSASDDDM